MRSLSPMTVFVIAVLSQLAVSACNNGPSTEIAQVVERTDPEPEQNISESGALLLTGPGPGQGSPVAQCCSAGVTFVKDMCENLGDNIQKFVTFKFQNEEIIPPECFLTNKLVLVPKNRITDGSVTTTLHLGILIDADGVQLVKVGSEAEAEISLTLTSGYQVVNNLTAGTADSNPDSPFGGDEKPGSGAFLAADNSTGVPEINAGKLTISSSVHQSVAVTGTASVRGRYSFGFASVDGGLERSYSKEYSNDFALPSETLEFSCERDFGTQPRYKAATVRTEQEINEDLVTLVENDLMPDVKNQLSEFAEVAIESAISSIVYRVQDEVPNLRPGVSGRIFEPVKWDPRSGIPYGMFHCLGNK